MPRIFDFAEVLEFQDTDRVRVQRWCDAGIIKTGGGGSQGRRREFSFLNLIEIAVLEELRGLGVGEPGMRHVVNGLPDVWNNPNAPTSLNPKRRVKYRNAPILWIVFKRFVHRGQNSERVLLDPITPEDLIERLTVGKTDQNGTPDGITEAGIAIPLGSIISDLEKSTGEIFDLEAHVTRRLREALEEKEPKK